MKKIVALLTVAGGALLALPAHAQFAKPEDAVRYRQSAMNLLGNHAGRVHVQLKSGSPDLSVLQSSAMLMETLSKLPFEAFVPGSENAGNTKAKPEVFKDAKFKDLAEKMQAEVSKLAVATRSGDVKAMQVQFGAVGKACKNCHDDYQKK